MNEGPSKLDYQSSLLGWQRKNIGRNSDQVIVHVSAHFLIERMFYSIAPEQAPVNPLFFRTM